MGVLLEDPADLMFISKKQNILQTTAHIGDDSPLSKLFGYGRAILAILRVFAHETCIVVTMRPLMDVLLIGEGKAGLRILGSLKITTHLRQVG